MRPEVHLTAFATAHRDGAVVIDVREPAEYAAGHVDGAVLIPVGDVVARAGELPRGVPVYVICASGNRSLAAADYLVRVGIDARSVAGGTAAWLRAGHPVTRGTRTTA
ncbi:rhodanese-like domain-containing protein [Actinoplanes sp. ATCC 53533]|uniref:rhodanese-like domain-containing protein n=1 Tax=Actinoplanes sp. ATCC 53533 TaxID=1288362 RepID=UPI001F22ADF2|nr:rhodanese-like domain-containing protein [Actinoplanes sp. ATCC 53533]